MAAHTAEEYTWTEFYEFLEIRDASSKVCVEGIPVDMLDSTGQGGHGQRLVFRIVEENDNTERRQSKEAKGCKWEMSLAYRSPG